MANQKEPRNVRRTPHALICPIRTLANQARLIRSGMPQLILFNKPYNVLCQFTDTEGRPTLAD